MRRRRSGRCNVFFIQQADHNGRDVSFVRAVVPPGAGTDHPQKVFLRFLLQGKRRAAWNDHRPSLYKSAKSASPSPVQREQQQQSARWHLHLIISSPSMVVRRYRGRCAGAAKTVTAKTGLVGRNEISARGGRCAGCAGFVSASKGMYARPGSGIADHRDIHPDDKYRLAFWTTASKIHNRRPTKGEKSRQHSKAQRAARAGNRAIEAGQKRVVCSVGGNVSGIARYQRKSGGNGNRK